MHIFAIATKVGTVSTPPTPSVPYNNVGMSDDSHPATGSFDGKNSYSAQATQAAGLIPGASVNVYGTTFVWPAADPAYTNNYLVQGQVLPVTPVSNAGTLAFLGSAADGASSGTATITYTDGSTQTFTLGMSDWALNGGNVSPSFGNQIAISTSYRNTPQGKQSLNVYVFYSEVGLQAGKTIQSVTLPTSTTGGQLHIFTVATRAGAPYPATAYNNVGTSNDSNPGSANFDFQKSSYSAQALQQAGLKQGNVVVANGTTFIWSAGVPGSVDNYMAQGQVIPVNAIYGANTLAFLGAASNGNGSGTVTITYVDGSTQTFTLGFTDWTLGMGKIQPAFGNKVVATLPYRNTPGGKQTVKTYVFYSEVALQYNIPVQSVTLSSTTTGGQIHIFAVATR